MNYYALVGLFNGVVVLLFSVGLLLRKPRINFYQSFLAFSISVGLWSICYSIWQIQTEHDPALLWMRIAMLMIYPSCFGFLWFAMEVCGVQIRKALKVGLIATPVVFMLLAFNSLMIKDVAPRLMFPYWPVPGNLMHFYVFSYCACVFTAFFLLGFAYFRSVGAHRWQIQWIIFTMAPAWFGGSTNWLLWYGVEFPPLPNFFVGVGWLLLVYAMLRTRLFDVDVLADYIQEARLSAIGLLTASIHHEIKSPVFVIRGLAESLAEKTKQAGSVEQVTLQETSEKIVQQTERIMEIIRKFRDFASRPKGQPVQMQNVKLKEALNNVRPMLQSQIDALKIEFDVSISDDIQVFADPYSLEEILLNLILNACQALRNISNPKIELSAVFLRKQEPKIPDQVRNDNVIVTIADNGPGIPKKDIARIFEPFYTTKADGTGLGLYVVKQLVERNHAKIQVESKIDKGTRFTVTLKSC